MYIDRNPPRIARPQARAVKVAPDNLKKEHVAIPAQFV
jgi:hypothetical protein